LTQNKSKTVHLPPVPDEYFGDFLRGYLDGDGNVVFKYYRKPGRSYYSKVFATRFTSGSHFLLKEIQDKLKGIGVSGSLYFAGGAWRLSYGSNDSRKLWQFMYHDGEVKDLIYLERKYRIFEKA